MAHVYVSNADSGDIAVLRMGSGGELTLQSRVSVGGQLMPMAIHPSRKTLHVVRRSEPMAVVSLAIDPVTRDLHPLGEAALPSLALVLVGLLPVILLSRTLRRS